MQPQKKEQRKQLGCDRWQPSNNAHPVKPSTWVYVFVRFIGEYISIHQHTSANVFLKKWLVKLCPANAWYHFGQSTDDPYLVGLRIMQQEQQPPEEEPEEKEEAKDVKAKDAKGKKKGFSLFGR